MYSTSARAMSHAMSLPRTLRARRNVSGGDVCDERQQFCGKPRIKERILPDNERKTDARQEQEAVSHVRGNPQPAAGRFQAADAAPGPQREQQRT
jgi:hypothetical protein